jgi:hypothetical protein
MIKCITDAEPDPEIINNPIYPVSVLNDINFTKPNSIDTRNKVRTILRKKFGDFL